MTFLLDTNVFAPLSQRNPHRGVERAFTKHAGELVTASIVVHEMWFGIERLPRSRRRTELERFMTEVVAGGTLWRNALGANRGGAWHPAAPPSSSARCGNWESKTALKNAGALIVAGVGRSLERRD
jgi:hypothetical protein